MKLKSNQAYPSFFYSIIMELNINIEISNMNRIINNKKILLFDNYVSYFPVSCIKIRYLLYVLELTCEHPEIEMYLKELLENYSINELDNCNSDGVTVLHCMMCRLSYVSLNSFVIVINFGININKQNRWKNTALHLGYYKSFEYVSNITGLFVKHGADLNILNEDHKTVLDIILYVFTYFQSNKDLKYFKILIMMMIDFGAKTNNIAQVDKHMLEFIESYQSNNIKPAIKN